MAETMTVEQAIAALPEGKHIHTFVNPTAGALLGADWSREQLVHLIETSPSLQITGEIAQGMKHGLAVDRGTGSLLFVETRHRTDVEVAA